MEERNKRRLTCCRDDDDRPLTSPLISRSMDGWMRRRMLKNWKASDLIDGLQTPTGGCLASFFYPDVEQTTPRSVWEGNYSFASYWFRMVDLFSGSLGFYLYWFTFWFLISIFFSFKLLQSSTWYLGVGSPVNKSKSKGGQNWIRRDCIFLVDGLVAGVDFGIDRINPVDYLKK